MSMTKRKHPVESKLSIEIVAGGPFAKPVLPFELHFRPPEDPILKRLSRRYNLEKIAGTGTDFARARRLKSWVRRQWNHGFDQLPSPYHAIDLLAATKTGKSFQCGHYSQAFVECCLAVGLPARVIGVTRKEVAFPYNHPGNAGHVVAETYCRELQHWILFDCDTNCYFVDEKDRPVGAIDIHEALHAKKQKHIRLIQDRPAFASPQPTEAISQQELDRIVRDIQQHQTKQFYHNIHTGTVQGYQGSANHGYEAKCVRFAGCTQHPVALSFRQNDGEAGSTGFLTAQREHWDWPINRTYARATMLGQKPSPRVRVDLEHSMPFFAHYELHFNGHALPRQRGSQVSLTLRDDMNEFTAAAVDRTGRAGSNAMLQIRLRK